MISGLRGEIIEGEVIVGRWNTVSEKRLVSCSALEILEKTCVASDYDTGELDTGGTHKFYTMEASGWSNVIPVTEDGKLVLVKQFRIGLNDYTLEFPGGKLDGNEKPVEAVIREMTEETGYTLTKEGTVKELGWAFSNPAILNNKCHSFVAGPVVKNQDQKLDNGEMVEIVEVAVEDLPDLISEGKFRHALMLNSLFWLLFADQGIQALIVARLLMKSKITPNKSILAN